MAQPTTTPKIEELKARLKADSKSRHYFPLAEELRKIDRRDEAEKFLREGLTQHPTYLSAWISLGRVLSEAGKNREAVEVLAKALTLDGTNVVAARLLAEAYLALGEKVEAIKKFKLVNALLPNDEEIEGEIEKLDRELNPGKYPAVAPPAPAPAAAAPAAKPAASPATPAAPPIIPAPTPPARAMSPATSPPVSAQPPMTTPKPAPVAPASAAPAPSFTPAATLPVAPSHPVTPTPFVPPSPGATRPPENRAEIPSLGSAPGLESTPPSPAPSAPALTRDVFTSEADQESVFDTQKSEKQAFSTAPPPNQPFAAAASDFGPAGPSASSVESDVFGSTSPADVFSSAEADSSVSPQPPVWAKPEQSSVPSFAAAAEPATTSAEAAATLTMADLYAKQGHFDAAREIYDRILAREPGNGEVRRKLDQLPLSGLSSPDMRRRDTSRRLEQWLTKVTKRESGGRGV